MIAAEDRIPRTTVRVVGHDMSVAMAGRGPTVVLLHGNGSYSYMWRNLIPFLAQRFRCVAPDLLGMGASERLTPSGVGSYGFHDQCGQLDLLLDVLTEQEPIVIIGHELGAMMAMDHARRFPNRVVALVLIEGAFRITNDLLFDDDIRAFLADVRGPWGEDLVLQQNKIIEYWLPRLTIRMLSPGELDNYRRPYLRTGESRRAMLAMIRQLPLKSLPGPLDHLAEEIRHFYAGSDLPKLVIGGDPGFLVPPPILGTTARWPNTDVAAVHGRHFLAEDSPARLTAVILDWLASLDQRYSTNR